MRGTIALLAATALVAAAAPASVPARAHASGHSERLAARARRGDRVARTAIVEEHMGLVRSIAFRYRNLGLPVEDLVQEGAIGLLTAVDEYDPLRGRASPRTPSGASGPPSRTLSPPAAGSCESRALCSSAADRSGPPATC